MGPGYIRCSARYATAAPRWARATMVAMLLCLGISTAAWGNGEAEVIHRLDFTQPSSGDAAAWLREQGFELRMSASELSPRFTERGLVLSTDEAITGLFARELKLPAAERVRITWGVDRYPEGANWEKGVYRVPIAVMISFGDKEIGSGSLFVPNIPYFIGLFLSDEAKPGKAYTANYYHKGGRYLCKPCLTEPGQTVTTTLDLDESFQRFFDGPARTPPVSGLSFQMNTDDTRGGAQAFITSIEFLADTEKRPRPGLARPVFQPRVLQHEAFAVHD